MSYILVVGGVHIDVIAAYSSKFDANVDKIGSDLRISVGGAAHNIAAALALAKKKVALFSVIKGDSISETLIVHDLEINNIESEYLCRDDSVSESAFVAHVKDKHLASAVSLSTIEHVELDAGKLDKAIRNASVVVIDSNLSVNQIKMIASMATQHKKRLFGCCVSESKATRIVDAARGFDTTPFEVVTMNALEAKKLGLKADESSSPDEVKAFCRLVGARWAAVTRGAHGHQVFSLTDGTMTSYEAEPMTLKRDIGAGDAFLAAICAYSAEHEKIDWEKCHSTIKTFVRRAQKANDVPFSSFHKERISRREFLTPIWAAVASLAAVALCISSGDWRSGLYLYLLPLVSGIAGALVGRMLDEKHKGDIDPLHETAVMGGTAGLLSGVAFAVAQTGPAAKSLGELIMGNMATFSALLLVFGFLGGLSVKRFFGKWRRAELPEVPTSPGVSEKS